MRLIKESGYQTDTVEGLPGPTPAAQRRVPRDEVTIVPYHPSPFAVLKEAYASRNVARHLASAAISRNTRKFRLGAFWIIFSTFWSVIGYTVIFGGGVFHVKTPNHMPYFLYLIVGMMGWRLFQETLKESTRSFLRLRKIVYEFNFPLALVPTAGSSYALLQFVLYVIGYVGIVGYYWATKGVLYAQTSPRLMLMAIAGLGLCLVFAWGVGLWTGPLTAWARDVRQVINFAIPFYMFLTPVMYPIESLHGKMRIAAEINPLSSPVEMAKVGLLGAGAVRPYAAIWSICSIGLLFLSGLWFMTRYGHSLAAGMRLMGGDMMDDTDDDMM
jgi:ABC-type polysaccharide/polyol phosphate export permease